MKGASQMIFSTHHNYDSERNLKNEKKHFLGSPGGLVFMYGLCLVVTSYFNCWLTSIIVGIHQWANDPQVKGQLGAIMNGSPQFQGISGNINQRVSPANIGNFTFALHPFHHFLITLVLEIIALALFSRLIIRIYIRWRPNKYNQYGNDRLTTEPEVLRQYPIIADRDFSFAGYGGVPVMHFKPWSTLIKYHPTLFLSQYIKPHLEKGPKHSNGFYAIDQTTVNSLGIGITRSGKDETEITPLVDILSRAKKKASMAVFDPKTETLAMSYEQLRKRGYDVEVLNLDDTNFSGSYNPLAIIVQYAKTGYYDEAQEEINSLSTSMYEDPNAKDKFWQQSSASLLNSLVLAEIDYADRNNAWEQVTMDNVLHMLTDLGSKDVLINAAGQIIPGEDDEGLPEVSDTKAVSKSNKLTVYFAKLRHMQSYNFSKWRQMALDAFAQSKFAGEETMGNIYTSALAPLRIYQQSNIARLTSKNTINFEKMGFPRMLKLAFPMKYRFSTAVITITDRNGKVIEKNNSTVDKLSRLSYAVRNKLPKEFKINVSFNFRQNRSEILNHSIQFNGRKVFIKKGLGKHAYLRDPYSNQLILKEVKLTVGTNHLTGEVTQSILNYSEKPVALFIVTPPNNTSYNQLAAFAVTQIFNQLWGIATKNGRHLITRMHFIMNEFGNVPTIEAMDRKVSIGLGAGLLFDIFVQNIEQLEIHYTPKQAATIKSNCSNWLYILSNSEKTVKEISDHIGKQTVTVRSSNSRFGDARTTHINDSYKSQEILSPTELSNFAGGEMVTLRAVYRQDQKGNSVEAFPIFAHGSTKMPFRKDFLADEYNDQHTIADIGIKAPHRDFSLEDNRIDYDEAYLQVLNDDVAVVQANSKSNDDEEMAKQNFYQRAENQNDATTNVIFTPEELQNQNLIEWANLNIPNFIDDQQIKANFVQQIQKLGTKFWSIPNVNNWDYINSLLQGDEKLFARLQEIIELQKKQYQ